MEEKRKQYAVLGLGNFGASLAVTLQKTGCDVVVVDRDMDRIREISDYVSYAMRANIEDEAMLQSLEVQNLDGVIVATADSLEASIMATLLCKEMGAPFILAKAQNQLHADVLKKVGADEVIRSEYEMGKRVAQHLVSTAFSDWIALSSEYSIVERTIPKSWIGKSIRELDIRGNYGVNVVAVRKKETVEVEFDPDEPLLKGEILVLVGADEKLREI